MTARTAPPAMTPIGTQTYRAGCRTAWARTSGSVYSQPVDATCTDDPTKRSHTSPRVGLVEAEGARKAAATIAPMVRRTVAHSHVRDARGRWASVTIDVASGRSITAMVGRPADRTFTLSSPATATCRPSEVPRDRDQHNEQHGHGHETQESRSEGTYHPLPSVAWWPRFREHHRQFLSDLGHGEILVRWTIYRQAVYRCAK